MTAPLLVETDGAVTTLIFNRPARRNALSRDLLAALRAALASAAAGSCRAVILAGADGGFSAGADIAELTGDAADAGYDQAVSEIAQALEAGPFVTIAAIEGYCIGAALDLACACDVRVVSAAAWFELPAVKLGLLYNPVAVARLHRVLPAATLRRLLLLGDRISGPEAAAAGLSTRLADANAARAVAAEIAGRVIARPRAAIETKYLLADLDRGSADIAAWQKVQLDILRSPERQAALASARSRQH